MTGHPGERRTGEEVLEEGGLTGPEDPYAGFKGLAYGALTDPMLLAGHAGEMAKSAVPSREAMAQFAADDSGALNWNKFGSALRESHPKLSFDPAAPEKFFESRGLDIADLPAVKAEAVGEKLGVPVDWMSPRTYKQQGYGPLSHQAFYRSADQTVYLPTNQPMWTDPKLMAQKMQMVGPLEGSPFTPWQSTGHPFHVPTHEFTHALHHQEDPFNFIRLANQPINHVDFGRPSRLTPEEAGWAKRIGGIYAQTDPLEAVAEIGARQVLDPAYRPKPFIEDMMRRFKAPDLAQLKALIPR